MKFFNIIYAVLLISGFAPISVMAQSTHGLGGKPATEKDWEGIPVLRDACQLDNSCTDKQLSEIKKLNQEDAKKQGQKDADAKKQDEKSKSKPYSGKKK